jgi:hypothetical protein
MNDAIEFGTEELKVPAYARMHYARMPPLDAVEL